MYVQFISLFNAVLLGRKLNIVDIGQNWTWIVHTAYYELWGISFFVSLPLCLRVCAWLLSTSTFCFHLYIPFALSFSFPVSWRGGYYFPFSASSFVIMTRAVSIWNCQLKFLRALVKKWQLYNYSCTVIVPVLFDKSSQFRELFSHFDSMDTQAKLTAKRKQKVSQKTLYYTAWLQGMCRRYCAISSII